MSDADDRGDGETLEPRENPELIGHEAAERLLLSALRQQRLAHGWLITGPRGVGKATLAYRIARYLLSGRDGGGDLFGAPPDSLAVPVDDEAFRRVASGGHPDLIVLQREPRPNSDILSNFITVDQVRRLSDRFALTSGAGGWRIAVIDCAEEMNANAANALLKLLEEPPPRSLLLLVSHAPGRLLPTIRSRCRRLSLRPLAAGQVAAVLAAQRQTLPAEARAGLTQLADGSPGRALALAEVGGLDTYAEIQAVLQALPKVDFAAVHALGDRLARRGQDAAYHTWMDLFRLALNRLVRLGIRPIEAGEESAEQQASRRLLTLAPLDRWVELWEKVGDLAARAESVNLDRKQVVFNAFVMLEATVRRT